MPAYIPITELETDPGAPGTSELWKKWRDNPLAIAEGAPGAPRIRGKSLGNISMGAITVAGAGGQGYIDCDSMGLVAAQVVGVVATSRVLRARYSSNNGSTYGGWQNIVTTPSGRETVGCFSGSMRLNLQTGLFYFAVALAINPTFPPDNRVFSASGVHTVPDSCNAFQLSWDAASNTMNADFLCLGGVE